MAGTVWVDVVVRGPLFDKRIDKKVKAAIIEECLVKVEKRLMRPRKRNRLGRPARGCLNNKLTAEMLFGGYADKAGAVVVSSTTKNPRTKGTTWQGAQAAIVRKMAPNVLRKAAKRITGEL